MAACPATDGGASTLSFTNQTYASDPRVRPNEAVFSGLNTEDDPYTQVLRLHNGGTAAVTVTSLGIAPNANLFPASYRQHSNTNAFGATLAADAGTALPATIAAGGDLDIVVQFLSTQTDPPSRFDNVGGDAVAALLVAQTNDDCAQAGLYGVSLWNDPESISDAGIPTSNYGRYEPTLGQIIATLGYQVDVGEDLKTFLNANQSTPFAFALPSAGGFVPSDEVVIRDFVQADPTKPAVLLAVARFAPKLDFPFGFFPSDAVSVDAGQPSALAPLEVPDGATFPPGIQYVATMSSVNHADPYTSDHSEMVLPPIYGNADGTFSLDGGPFGIWCFGAQRSDSTIGWDGSVSPNVPNGDYDYSHDELNIVTSVANPALPPDLVDAGVNFGLSTPVHRYRFWPLKDRAGNLVPNSYLAAIEEATNCDYQDMIFTLSNVMPAPQADAGGGAPDAATDGPVEAD